MQCSIHKKQAENVLSYQPKRMSLPPLIFVEARSVSCKLNLPFICANGLCICSDAFRLYATVWRHVLGPNDIVDKIDIALGKCKYSFLH